MILRNVEQNTCRYHETSASVQLVVMPIKNHWDIICIIHTPKRYLMSTSAGGPRDMWLNVPRHTHPGGTQMV